MSYRLSKMIDAFQAIVVLAATLLPTGEFISFLCVVEREARERKLLAQRDFKNSQITEHE